MLSDGNWFVDSCWRLVSGCRSVTLAGLLFLTVKLFFAAASVIYPFLTISMVRCDLWCSSNSRWVHLLRRIMSHISLLIRLNILSFLIPSHLMVAPECFTSVFIVLTVHWFLLCVNQSPSTQVGHRIMDLPFACLSNHWGFRSGLGCPRRRGGGGVVLDGALKLHSVQYNVVRVRLQCLLARDTY